MRTHMKYKGTLIVVKDCKESGTYVGSPAKKIK